MVEVGFVKEEVGQGVVVVEETLAEYIHSRGENYVSGSAYNVSASSKDKLLSSCFRDPFHDVRNMLLGRNHMM